MVGSGEHRWVIDHGVHGDGVTRRCDVLTHGYGSD
jgi:hypothetical protein